jgi:ABC-2 type transport system ATP-binding protein
VSEDRRDIVCVEGLVKEFPVGLGLRRKRVLDGISFCVRENEIFGFVGPNGAGKTTALKALMGLIRPNAGRASILGHDVRESAFRRHVGYLPESSYFYEYLTGREILRFYARLSGLVRPRLDQRVDMLLDWVGLAHAADARLRSYSKGMLQRIGIAQALVHDPQVVFLDEPMSGLDPIGRKEIRDLILRLHAEGKTVFMNTHILSDVELICDRVAIIVQGAIRYEGRVEHFSAVGEAEADVVLARVPPHAVADLEERFGRVTGRGEQVELRVPAKRVGELLELALAQGADVASVLPHRSSLESIFLSAVQQAGAPARRPAP